MAPSFQPNDDAAQAQDNSRSLLVQSSYAALAAMFPIQLPAEKTRRASRCETQSSPQMADAYLTTAGKKVFFFFRVDIQIIAGICANWWG
jgi:hypothetical protein